MVAVCPATEPARFLASSPAIGHACSLTRSHVEAADGAGALCPCAASLECCLSFAARSIPARCHLGIAVISRVIRSVCSSFGAHHAPVTEPATTFAHGRLRASHAVCLRCSTLEPVFCARKEEADIECVSTTGRLLAESLVMQGDFFDTQTVSFGFYATSRQCIPRRSPRNSNAEETANNGAAENCSARHGSCYSRSWPSRSFVALAHVRCRLLRSTFAATAPRSAVSELESLAVAA